MCLCVRVYLLLFGDSSFFVFCQIVSICFCFILCYCLYTYLISKKKKIVNSHEMNYERNIGGVGVDKTIIKAYYKEYMHSV